MYRVDQHTIPIFNLQLLVVNLKVIQANYKKANNAIKNNQASVPMTEVNIHVFHVI